MARTPAEREVYFVNPFYLVGWTAMTGAILCMFGAALVQFWQDRNLEWYFLPLSLLISAFSLWAWFAFLTLRLVVDHDGVECTNFFQRLWRFRLPWEEIEEIVVDEDRNQRPGRSVFGRTAYFHRRQGKTVTLPISLLWNRQKAEAALIERMEARHTLDRKASRN